MKRIHISILAFYISLLAGYLPAQVTHKKIFERPYSLHQPKTNVDFFFLGSV
jgi:hypothetical protein